jgi:hypothetical protein
MRASLAWGVPPVVQLRRLAVLATLLCAAASHAGLKLTYELKRKGKVSTMVLQMDGKSARMEMTEEGVPRGSFIRDGDARRVYLVQHEKKTFTEISEDDLQRMRAQMEAARARLQEQMAKMTPEQRKQMEAMLNGQQKMMEGLKAQETYARASGSKKVAGYSCELYRVEMDGAHVADTCLIPWNEVKVDREQLRQSLEALRGGALFQGTSSFGSADAEMKAWGTDVGLPAWRKQVKDDGDEPTETTLQSIAAIPKETFAPPAGYARQSIGAKQK